MTQDNFINHFRQEFFQEAREILEAISDDILKLEADPENEELLNAVFRGIHTIKGSAGSFDLAIISDFTHHLEGVLNALRDRKIALSPALVDVILSGSDQISEMIEICASGQTPALNHELIERIVACLPSTGEPSGSRDLSGSSDSDQGSSCPEEIGLGGDHLQITGENRGQESKEQYAGYMANSVENATPLLKQGAVPDDMVETFLEKAANGQNIFKVILNYTSAHFENGYDPLVFLKNLYDGCSLYHVVLQEPNPVPGVKTFEPLHLYLDPVIYVATAMTRNEIVDLVFDEELIAVEELVEKPCAMRGVSTSGVSCEVFSASKGGEALSSSTLMRDIINSQESMSEFIDGAVDMLQTAEKAVMEYEKGSSSSALDELFRSVHNIKGDADLMGFKELVLFTHAFESILDLLRLEKLTRTPEIVELALESVDFIKSAISEISRKRDLPPLGKLYKSIQKYLSSVSGKEAEKEDSSTTAPSFAVEDKELHKVYLEQILQFRSILIQFMENPSAFSSGGISLRRTLQDIARASGMVGHESLEQSAGSALLAAEPSTALDQVMEAMEELIGEPKKIGEILISEGKIKEEDLSQALEAQKPVGQILLESGKLSQKDLDSALSRQKLLSSVQKTKVDEQQSIKTMRVDEHKVESFSNLVGEMLIARNTYSYLLNRLTSAQNENETLETLKDLKENLHLFSRLTNDVQHGVVSLRMIPVRGIFQKFSRVVRDISRKQNKMIEMITDGEDIEIDKKVADVLSDPLIHLIRNSCDHGIETPVERKRAAKPEKGTVLLKASKEGSHLVIRINDDGRGINREKLLEKAIQHGLNFSSVNDPGLLDVIFMPGLATADQITDVSGRGVGMDVVKTTIHSLGGTVSVMSEQGAGTQLTLTIPTSMGIETVLLVEVGGNSYAIPINYIMETLKIPVKTFIRAGDQLMFYYRGEVLSAHLLSALLNPDGIYGKQDDGSRGGEVVAGSASDLMATKGELMATESEISMVIIKTSRERYGIIIDRFDKNMEIAVKPMPDMLSYLDVISGISILGDGRVLLVINPEQLAG